MTPYIKPSEKINGTELQDILDIVWDEIDDATKSLVLESLRDNEINHEV